MNTRKRATPKLVTEEAIYLAFCLLSMYRDDVTDDSSLAFFEDKIPKMLTYLLEPLKRQLMKYYDERIAKDYVFMMGQVLHDPYLKVPSTKYEEDKFIKHLNRYTRAKFLEFQLQKNPTYDELSRTLLWNEKKKKFEIYNLFTLSATCLQNRLNDWEFPYNQTSCKTL